MVGGGEKSGGPEKSGAFGVGLGCDGVRLPQLLKAEPGNPGAGRRAEGYRSRGRRAMGILVPVCWRS